jgi:hypothetical protein
VRLQYGAQHRTGRGEAAVRETGEIRGVAAMQTQELGKHRPVDPADPRTGRILGQQARRRKQRHHQHEQSVSRRQRQARATISYAEEGCQRLAQGEPGIGTQTADHGEHL